MKFRIRTSLVSVAVLAVIAGSGLSSCSKPSDQAASDQAGPQPADTAVVADETPSAAEQDINGQSAQNAKALLKRMADYLDAQQTISLTYDSIFEVVTAGHQKLQLATSGTVDLNRPDKMHTTRKSGFSDTETFYDGKTLTFFGKGQNAYIQADVSGTVDSVIDQLRDKFHRQLPGADLLQSGVYEALMTGVTDVKDLGSGEIGGVECDHLAFRAKDTDWQIWIAQGATPYPCRYVITSKGVDQAPEYAMQIREWRAGSAAGTGNFSFTPPAGAQRMDIKDLEALKDTSDLPANYKLGAAK